MKVGIILFSETEQKYLLIVTILSRDCQIYEEVE